MKNKITEYLKIILNGKVLLLIGADKVLGHIIFTFAMAIVFIWLNIQIESTVHRKEENKAKLENIRSLYTEKECELTSLNSICKVQVMLRDMGSKVAIPTDKAKRVK